MMYTEEQLELINDVATVNAAFQYGDDLEPHLVSEEERVKADPVGRVRQAIDYMSAMPHMKMQCSDIESRAAEFGWLDRPVDDDKAEVLREAAGLIAGFKMVSKGLPDSAFENLLVEEAVRASQLQGAYVEQVIGLMERTGKHDIAHRLKLLALKAGFSSQKNEQPASGGQALFFWIVVIFAVIGVISVFGGR